MLNLKKFMATLMTLAIIIVYPCQIFADNSTTKDEEFSEAPIVLQDESQLRTLGSSLSGGFGTAYIGYMDSARMLNWRLTPTKMIGSFAGTIKVTTTSGRLVKTYYVSGGGMSPSGQVSVSSLKKGTYLAKFEGNGLSSSGSHFYILPGLHYTFTKK
jgi:hypothetical protein